jgi:hypothetical protein
MKKNKIITFNYVLNFKVNKMEKKWIKELALEFKVN